MDPRELSLPDATPAAPSDSGLSPGDEPTRVSSTPATEGGAIPLGPSIEGYVLTEELHRGGQGIVYRALQLGTKRVVALKVLLEGPYAAQSTRQRFEREIELAASLRHPNIVTILDSGLSSGRYYFAMEFIDGVRLDRYLAQRRPPLPETLVLFEKVCQAVNFAHQRGVIHRDLKPANILVDRDGEPHILDFGLAKPIHATAGGASTIQVLSTSGQLLGTVAYMSPEQAAGSQDVDVRSDVYSLGVIFYDALVGQPPYPVDGPLGEVLRRISHDDPLNPRSLAARTAGAVRIDDELATILLKTLEKEPQRRYQTAGELARDLRHLLQGEPIEAKRASTFYMVRKTLRRYRWQAAMASVVLLMLVGFLITFAVLFTSERSARRQADEKTQEARRAVERQEAALQEARQATHEALRAQRNLERSLTREQLQRGDLALQRWDLLEARDSYWDAQLHSPGPTTLWALRRFFLQTGNTAARLLALQPPTVVQLSPTGRLAAVATTPQGLTLYDCTTGVQQGWRCLPAVPAAIEIQDDGTLAAAGDGWAAAWPAEQTVPAVVAHLGAWREVRSVHATPGGDGVLIVMDDRVLLVVGFQGRRTQVVRLEGKVSGKPQFSGVLGQLALPTQAGVELVTLRRSGPLVALGHAVPFRHTSAPVRAVRFDGEKLLAALADGVYVAPLLDTLPSGNWTRVLPAEPGARDFELDYERGRFAFILPDDEIAVCTTLGGVLHSWRFKVRGLADLRLVGTQHELLAVDADGVLTRWQDPASLVERTRIADSQPEAWAVSADGSTALVALERGRVIAYHPTDDAPQTVLRPRLLPGLPGLGDTSDMALALSGDGRRGVIRDGKLLRFQQLADQVLFVSTWSDPVLTMPDRVALSSDGELIAVLARSPAGDRQQIALRRWPRGGAPSPEPQPFDFVGAAIRELAFVPGTHVLLVLRSNGQVLRLDADAPERQPALTSAVPPNTAPNVWLHLPAPPVALALDRTGERAAIATEEGVVHVVDATSGTIAHRIRGVGDVAALAFSPRDELLLVRGASGTVRLFNPVNGERVTAWEAPAAGRRPFAAWLGEADAILLSDTDGVIVQRVGQADALLAANRPFVMQRNAARRLEPGDARQAWHATVALADANPQLGQATRALLLEALLRQPGTAPERTWAETLLAEAPAYTWLRLGHAAYDGERFDMANEWLAHGVRLVGDGVDARTLQRAAECRYLAGDYADAAELLATVQRLPDFDRRETPTVMLMQVAALTLDGRSVQARLRAGALNGLRVPEGLVENVRLASTKVLARVVTGLADESLVNTAQEDLLAQFDASSLRYRDDGPFFLGELARQTGDTAKALVQYQRCIDLSRDTWPANWARYRLTQLRATANVPTSQSAAARTSPAPTRSEVPQG